MDQDREMRLKTISGTRSTETELITEEGGAHKALCRTKQKENSDTFQNKPRFSNFEGRKLFSKLF